ncbi:RNA polymerase sigma factor [Carboxylicivirga sediminis]|uniref:RNA polymerase sigma factor n=1 Tax=Carboxylicivirga sediminis TaxID=2006564 RepID=A0A941IYG4_9BACT|nr:RNA polymerase sigma factor [Carboxylicivirga sediminis]MBR8537856.1 RNA polymerase sigma factor [Carboxylicivirga sediminis]
MTEEQLINSSKQGNKLAFAQLIDKYTSYLYQLVFRIINNEEESKDILQDTFIVVWQKLSQYDAGKSKFTTWLYTIATRQAISSLRKRKHHIPVDDGVVSKYCEDAYYQLANKEVGELILKATKNLSPLQKVVFVLRDVEELEVDEVRQITGLSAKQIKDNLYVARKLIRDRLMKHVTG